MADLHLESNVSFKDKLMKSTWRLDSVAVSDFDFDPDLVDGMFPSLMRLRQKWQLKRGMQLIDIDHVFYFVKFDLKEDKEFVLTGGPWIDNSKMETRICACN
ncbi:hypothetical protein FF1_029606 [Malus domestica]